MEHNYYLCILLFLVYEIVDFQKFIELYPFKPDTRKRVWSFTLEDPLLPWNQGGFTLTIDRHGNGKVEPTGKRHKDKIDIQTMTTMLLGYKRPDYLNKIGRLVCNENTVDMLEDAIEQQTSYFSDYF